LLCQDLEIGRQNASEPRRIEPECDAIPKVESPTCGLWSQVVDTNDHRRVSIEIVEITERRRSEPVAEDLRMALQELMRKAELDGDVDFLRDGARVLAQELMEL
jgi:hypothetical protein